MTAGWSEELSLAISGYLCLSCFCVVLLGKEVLPGCYTAKVLFLPPFFGRMFKPWIKLLVL